MPLNPRRAPCAVPAPRARLSRSSGWEAGALGATGAVGAGGAAGAILAATGMTTNRYSRGGARTGERRLRSAMLNLKRCKAHAVTRKLQTHSDTHAITARRTHDRQWGNRHGGPARRQRGHERHADLHDDSEVLRGQAIDSAGARRAI